MSIPSNKNRSKDLEELARELRQFHGLGASFFRVAAAQTGKTVTDMQVLDILDITGPTTAGNLAELTGLTTGAVTGLLNRLEEAELVRRERDPEDGRRIIVQLVTKKKEMHEIEAVLAPLGNSLEEMASGYSDEQIAFLVDFLKSSNAISRREIVRLQEAPAGVGKEYSAPLAEVKSARLIVSSGITMLTLRVDAGMADLYKARFEGPLPEVRTRDGAVNIRYPRRLWAALGGAKRIAEVTLNAAVPWQIGIQGGASGIFAQLGGLDLVELQVKAGASEIQLNLPSPSRMVQISISGGSSDIVIRRPSGVPARLHLKGWYSALVFDDQSFNNLGNDVRMQSPEYEATAPGSDIEVLSSASMVRVTSG